jgi:hypothetical protein
MTRELALAEAVNQAFQVFLAAGARLRLQVSFVDIGGEFIKTLVAGQDLIKSEGYFRDIHGELVRIPACQIVAAIDIDRSEDAERGGQSDLMLEVMTGKNGVVLFDICLNLTGRCWQPDSSVPSLLS